MIWDVIGIGENSIDHVYRLPGPPEPNTKIAVAGRRISPGGQVATTLCACAAFGLRAKYIGAFGSDEEGARVRAALEQRGVDTGDAVTRAAPNRHAVILVDDRTGDRTVLWHRDAALALAPSDVTRDRIGKTRLLHVDATDGEAALAAARLAREAGARVTCDLDAVTARTDALLAVVDVAILAESVPGEITGEHAIEGAVHALQSRFRAQICVTLGARGALLHDGERLHAAPAFPIDAVDTTGAGDVFRAGFIRGLLRGDPPPRILRFASAAAALACTRHGAIESIPSLDEVHGLADGWLVDGG